MHHALIVKNDLLMQVSAHNLTAMHIRALYWGLVKNSLLEPSLGPSPSWEKRGTGINCMRMTPSNESLGLAILSVNFPSIYDVYNSLVPTFEKSDTTEVRLGSSWIIPQPFKEKQRFSVRAVDFVKMMPLNTRPSFLPRGAGSEASQNHVNVQTTQADDVITCN